MTKHGAVQWYDSESVSDVYGPVTFDPALEYYAKNYLGTSVLQLIVITLVLLGVGLFLFGCIFGYFVGKCSSGPKREGQDMPEPEFEPTSRPTENVPPVGPQQAGHPEPSAPPPPPPEPAERPQPRVPPPPPPEPEATEGSWRGIFRDVYCSVPGKMYKSELGDHFHLSPMCQSGFRSAYTPVKGYKVCLHCMRTHSFTLYNVPTADEGAGHGSSSGSHSSCIAQRRR